MNELEKLYNAVSSKFDVGSYDDFTSKMSDTDSRKRFYDAVSQKGFDLGDYNEYEQRLSGKPKGVEAEENGVSGSPSASTEESSLDTKKSNLEYGKPQPLSEEEAKGVEQYVSKITKPIDFSGVKLPFESNTISNSDIYKSRKDKLAKVDNEIFKLEKKADMLSKGSSGMSFEEILNTDGTYQDLKKRREQIKQDLNFDDTLLEKVSEDTNANFGTKSFIKNILRTFGYTEDPDQVLNLDEKVKYQLLDNLGSDTVLKEKIANGYASLPEKEQMITKAKVDVITKENTRIQKEAETILATEPDETIKNEKLTKLYGEYESLLGSLGYDLADGMLKNSFQKTTDSMEFDEMVSSDGFFSETADAAGTFSEGLLQTAFKGSVGFISDVMSGAGDLSTDQEHYSVYDAFGDTVRQLGNFNLAPSSSAKGTKLVDSEGNLVVNYKTISKSLANTLPFTLMLINDAKKGKVTNIEQSLGRLLNPTNSAKVTESLRLIDSAYRHTFSDNLQDAKSNGLEGAKGLIYANAFSLAEGMAELIMPDTKFFKSTVGANLLNTFKGDLKSAATRAAMSQTIKNFAKNIAMELGEEEVTALAQDLTKYAMVVGHENSEFWNLQKQKELAANTIVMSGALSGINTTRDFNANKDAYYREVANGINGVQENLQEMLNNKNLTEEEKKPITETMKWANNLSLVVSKAPKLASSKTLDLLIEKQNLLEEKKQLDDSFHPEMNERIEKLNEKIRTQLQIRKAVKEDVKEATPKQYSQSMSTAINEMAKTDNKINLQVDAVTEQGAQAIVDEGGKLFMTKDGKSGAYVKADGYMGGLFKNPNSTLEEVGKVLQEARLEAGGKYFDAYGTKLEDIYIKNGFKPVARVKFNEEYAPEGWDAKDSPLKTKPDVVFFKYDPNSDIKKGEGKVFETYDEAQAYTKTQLNEQNTTNQISKEGEGTTKGTGESIQTGENRGTSANVEGNKKAISEEAGKLANTVRKLKVNSSIKDAMSKLNSRPTALFEVAWDGAMESVATTIELTGNFVQAVYDGIEHLKQSNWYRGLSPEGRAKAERMFREDLHRQYDGEKESPSFKDSMKASIGKLQEKAIQRLIDKYEVLRKTIRQNFDISEDSKNFSQAEINMHGKAANDIEKFDKQMKEITKEIASKGFTLDNVSDYLYAKHAGERNTYIKEHVDPENEFGSGMTPQEIDRILNRTFTEDQIKELEAIADKFYDITQGTRDIMKEFGLINEEQYNALQDFYKNYVPLTGFEDQTIDSVNRIEGSKMDINGHILERSSGRSTRADNVIANIISARVSAVVKARKNEVLQTLYNLAEENPNNQVMKLYTPETVPSKTVIDKSGKKVKQRDDVYRRDDYVGVKVDGEQYYLKFANKELGRVLNHANVEKSNVITKVLRSLNRYLSTTLTTLNPEFVISNFSRDIQTAVLNVMAESDINEKLKGQNIAASVIKDTGKSIKAIYSNERSGKVDTEFQKFYEEFKADGAKTGWANQADLKSIKKKMETMVKRHQAKGFSRSGVVLKAKEALEFVNDVNTAVENGVRLSAYVNGRRAGMTRAQAARMAKELTVNFNKSGEYGTVANSLYLFFNAAIQGNVRFIKAMTTLKKTVQEDGSVKKSLNRGQKLALALTAFASLVTLLNQSISDDDEDGESFYSKIPDFEKERNFIIMNPVNGKDYFKIPLPYGYNIFHNFGTVATEVATGKRDVGDGIGFLTNATVGAFSPVSFGNGSTAQDALINAGTPTIAKPIVDLARNEDYFGSQIYNENFPMGTPKPDASLGRRTTPQVFKDMASFINEVTGGNEYESGAVDFSPESMYYIYKFAIGGTGKFLTNAAETAGTAIDIAKGENKELEARKVPFVRKVYGEPNKYVDQANFFDRFDELRQKHDAVQARAASEKDMNNRSRINNVLNTYKEVTKKLKEIRKQKKKVESTVFDPITRTEKLNQLDEKYYRLIKKANRAYNEKIKNNN